VSDQRGTTNQDKGPGTLPGDAGRHDLAAVAARARVAALLERLTHLDLQVLVVAAPDRTRLTARETARTAAETAGRGSLFDEAVTVARQTTIQAFARGGFTGTWAATDMAMSVASASDRIAAAAALEEAAMAEVVEDLVDEETLDILRSTTRALGSLKGIPQPGSLAAVGMPQRGVAVPLQFVAVSVFALALTFGGLAVLGVAMFCFGIAMIVGVARRRNPIGD
jgi:hypothetical protein